MTMVKHINRPIRENIVQTALIRVHNDIAMAMDQHNSVILVLLDLSAAFDTVDHGILLSRVSNLFGITAGPALQAICLCERKDCWRPGKTL